MDWSDERYVRLYTRDTPTWLALEWDGQSVLSLLLRKVDRAGILEFQDDGVTIAVKAVTGIPLEIVESGLSKILRLKVASIKGQLLVIPNFIEAQEASASDKQRMKEYRARRRDLAKHDVTIRNDGATLRNSEPAQPESGVRAPAVTSRNDSDTKRNGRATKRLQTVTPYYAVPYRTDLSSLPTGEATAKDLTGSQAEPTPELQQQQNGHSGRIPCPKDLWEQMPEPTKSTMDTFPIHRAAQEYMCREFAARYAGRLDQERTLDQWVASAVRAMHADWNDPNKRPKVEENPRPPPVYKSRRF